MEGVYAFDDADEALTFMPTAVRRALDVAGLKLSLTAWQAMSLDDKRRILTLGAADVVDVEAIRASLPDAPRIDPVPDPVALPGELSGKLSPEQWTRLRPLDRYALVKSTRRPDKLARALREIVATA